jgi:hypothetical protein
MNALDVIRWASRENVDLNIRGGRLFVWAAVPLSPDFEAAIRANKSAVVASLEELATDRARLQDFAHRCLPLTPADLTAAERSEADHLARDLAESGNLGHFVVDLCAGWPNLNPRDRLAACLAWQMAAESIALKDAA